MVDIIAPGPLTTVQDGGRRGFMRFGVSVSGAMDGLSLALANLIVGNARDEAALEATLKTPALLFLDDTLFSVTGGICEPTLNGRPVPMDMAVLARAGETLESAVITRGCRAYIAFQGGLRLEKALGSASCDKKAGIGGLKNGERLFGGDRLLTLPASDASIAGRRLKDGAFDRLPSSIATLRVTDGPQADALSFSGREAFFSEEYTVLPESDRMGVRFLGAPLAFAEGQDGNIITDAIYTGAVQITGAGQPILMMADAQTTGGYSKPFWVISADLPITAQLRPGDKARFSRCTLQEAHEALYERERALLGLEEAWRKKHMRVTVNGTVYEISVEER